MLPPLLRLLLLLLLLGWLVVVPRSHPPRSQLLLVPMMGPPQYPPVVLPAKALAIPAIQIMPITAMTAIITRLFTVVLLFLQCPQANGCG